MSTSAVVSEGDLAKLVLHVLEKLSSGLSY